MNCYNTVMKPNASYVMRGDGDYEMTRFSITSF